MDKPETSEVISWTHVRRIFGFNLALFAVAFGVLLLLIALGSGYSASDLQEDLPVGLGVILFLSFTMALYVANLYRRSWNRRAKYLSSEDEALS